jgi:formylglycine-generating enzyme required for sulfatase activity
VELITELFMRSKRCSFLTMLALLVGIFPALAQVTNLGIAPAPGGQSIIYWPTSTTNYVLQTTTNLATPNWVAATNAVTVNAVTVASSTPAGYFRLLATTNTTAGMMLIPEGWFMMGNLIINSNGVVTSDTDIAGVYPTNIYVSAFYMDVNLVSLNQWAAVYAYAAGHGYTFTQVGAAKSGNNPVQAVEWYDCVAWCNARSAQSGLSPCYYTDARMTQIYTNATGTNVFLNLTNNGYRLPTEAEWEKAARGGLRGQRFPWGNLGNSISESQANYSGDTASASYDLGPNGYNSIGSIGGTSPATSPVGSFAPNGYGLFDMAGNEFEWCWDWYGTAYGQPTTIDPTGAGPGSGNRIIRGGSGNSSANFARCAYRLDSAPGLVLGNVGFRCVRRY